MSELKPCPPCPLCGSPATPTKSAKSLVSCTKTTCTISDMWFSQKEWNARTPYPRVERLVKALKVITCNQDINPVNVARAALAEYTGTEPGKGDEG